MKKRRYTEEHIKQHESGSKSMISVVSCISNGTFYNWRSKYAGMEVSEAKRLKAV